MKNKITIKDIAKECNVSIATVSRVLNNSAKGVGPDTAKNVQEVMERLGYQPNALARSMVTGNPKLIGIVLPDIGNPFFAEVERGIEYVCNKKGYGCILCNTDCSPEREKRYINFFSGNMVSGVVFSTQNDDHEDSMLTSFEKTGIPYFLIERHLDDVDDYSGIYYDNVLGAETLTRYLINNNHKKIAHIAGPQKAHSGRERLQGYKNALLKAGIKYDPKLVIESDYKYSGGYKAIKKLIESNVEFSAIFSGNDLMGYGAMDYIKTIGKQVPLDYSIAGFDGVKYPNVFDNQLTSAEIPAYDTGILAAQNLIYKIENEDCINQKIMITPKLNKKGTVRKL